MLGLGIGLVTAVFTFVNVTLFQPWRVPDPDSLQFVRPQGRIGGDFNVISMPEYQYIRNRSRTMRHLSVTVRGGRSRVFYDADAFESVGVLTVSANYFEAMGLQMAAGRTFLQQEDSSPHPTNVVIISERLWAERFGGAPDIIGRSVRIERTALTVVGVAPRNFVDGHGPGTEVWRVLGLGAYQDPRHRTFPHSTLGRLADGSSDEEAAAELALLSAQFRAEHQLPEMAFVLVDTRPVSTGGIGERGQVAGLVFIALLLVQLLACANVGNLLLARALARQREVAVRMSLGAGRWRIVRQLFTEALVLALIAGGVGLALSAVVPAVAVSLGLPWIGSASRFTPTGETLAFIVGLSFLTAVAAGLTPALRATRVSLSSITAERHGQTAGTARLRRALLAAQISLATLLLMGAGLLTRGISKVSDAGPGFAIGEFQEVNIEFPAGAQIPRRRALYEPLYEATRGDDWPALAMGETRPIVDDRYGIPLRTTPTAPVQMVARRGISPDYFDTLGIQLLAGRAPAMDDDHREIVLNRSTAELLWPGESPIGKTLISGMRSDDWKTHIVVGVAPDLPLRSLARTEPVAYLTSQLVSDVLLVRSLDPAAVIRLRELASRIDPEVTVTSRPLNDLVADALYAARVGSWVAWGIGAVGLLLASIGAFGVFAYAVEERRREIGIRMAMGAQAAQVIRLVLRTTQSSVLMGLGAGVVLTAVAAPLLRSYLYGLSPFDPVAYLQVSGLLLAAALMATWIPARRATRINPAITLRAD
jgi:predicted permease